MGDRLFELAVGNRGVDGLPAAVTGKDQSAYRRFVSALVSHCKGRVHYWQCNNEPSNVDLLWQGSADEYVAQLQEMHAAVRASDPAAAVVLGGCGYDVLSSEPGSAARQFFEQVTDHGRDHFDLFAVHLYDDPTRIPSHLNTVRQMMTSHGYERPVMVGEYNGPTMFEFPELEAVIQRTMFAAFSEGEVGARSTTELAAEASQMTPERRAMQALYAAMPDLPERLQMFMSGCSPELAATTRPHQLP